MGKRFQKHFKGIRCWKKTSADANVESDAKYENVVEEVSQVKVQKRSRRLSKEEDLLQRIAELELYLTKTISDMYARLELQEKMNKEVLDKYLVKTVEGGGDVKEAHQRDDDYQKIRETVLCQIQQELRRLGKDTMDVGVVHDSRDDEANRPISEANNEADIGRSDGIPTAAEIPVVSTCSEPSTHFRSEEVSKDVVVKDTSDLLSIGTQTKLLSTTSDIADLGESRQALKPEVVDKDVPVSDQIATPMKSFSHRPRSTFEHLLDKSIAEVVKDHMTDEYHNPEYTPHNAASRAKFSPTEVWNLTPFREYCKRVSPPDPVPLHGGESPYNTPFTRRRGKSRLKSINLTIPTMLSTTSSQQSMKRKLSRLETTKPILWSNEVVEPDKDIKMPIKPNECNKKAEQAPIEVECFGKSVPDSGILTYAPFEVPVIAKDEADVIRDDFRSKLLYELKQKLIRIETVRRQAIEPIITEVYKRVHGTNIMEVQKLRKLCRQMFFEETTHYAKETTCGFGHLKLSHLALQYMHDAYQQPKAGTHKGGGEFTLVQPPRQIEHGGANMLVRPLKGMCRELFGINNVEKPELIDKLLKYGAANNHSVQDLYNDANNHSFVRQETYQPNAAHGDCCIVSKSGDLGGYFGAAVDPTETWKHRTVKWEVFTDDLVTDLVQLRAPVPFPDFNHAPTIDTTFPRLTVTVNLRDLMERYMNRRVFKERHARFLSINVLRGLNYLHAQGTVHGSIFQSKVVFNSSGYPTLMPNNELLGPRIPPRVEYSSPEEITSGPITMATDIFQTGLMTYWLMYGKSPYKGVTYMETKENLLNEEFTPKFVCGTLSRDGRNFLKKCLRTDPGTRFKLIKCKKSLEKAVKWFNVYEEGELANQNYPSPFKDLVLQIT